MKLDGEADKFGVLFDQIFETAFFKVLSHVFLHVEDDLGTTGDLLTIVGSDSKSAASVGLPSVLLVVVVFGYDNNFLSYEIGRVETHSKLTNHANVSACGDGFHESTCAGLSNGAEVVDEVGLLHANA